MIGSCDNCGKDGVPVFNGTSCGMETTQCHICNGDVLDPYGELEDAIAEAMVEPPQTAELQIERRADFLIRELDEFCALATNEETVDLIERERVAIGQVLIRAQLVASFLMQRRPGNLRVVR